MLFVLRPGGDNEELRKQSREFILSRVRTLEYEMESSEAALSKAYFTNDENTWQGQQNIADAETRYEKVVSEYKSAACKLSFEDRDKGRKIKIDSRAVPTPWKDDPDEWKRCFRRKAKSKI